MLVAAVAAWLCTVWSSLQRCIMCCCPSSLPPGSWCSGSMPAASEGLAATQTGQSKANEHFTLYSKKDKSYAKWKSN